MKEQGPAITLSLISHTNVGKTTLARTLLRRTIGEVLDQPHVTDIAEAHTMIEAPEGLVLRLWDTPGFGDTARLLRRLKNSGNPLGWLLGQVWDRFADRPLWCSQQAVRNVREEADVVLYLVNAAERPAEAGYVEMEMEILTWIGRPVIVLLNQIGPPRLPAEEKAEEVRWREHLRGFQIVRDVLSLDAFARCWVQEGVLLEAVERALPDDRRETCRRLTAAWREKNLEIFRRSMAVLADQLARACVDREPLEKQNWPERARAFLLGREKSLSGREHGMTVLAERLDENIRASMNELIRLHELEGNAAGEILRRLRSHYEARRPVSEGLAAVMGGFVSGALGGLAADIAAGGMTFGGGAIVGGLLGAAGAGGLAKGYNLVRGEQPMVRWSAEFFEGLVRSALLRYQAVAHFGRGRGNYLESESPKVWQTMVGRVVELRRAQVSSIWERGRGETDPNRLQASLESLLAECAAELLKELYPEANLDFEGPSHQVQHVPEGKR